MPQQFSRTKSQLNLNNVVRSSLKPIRPNNSVVARGIAASVVKVRLTLLFVRASGNSYLSSSVRCFKNIRRGKTLKISSATSAGKPCCILTTRVIEGLCFLPLNYNVCEDPNEVTGSIP